MTHPPNTYSVGIKSPKEIERDEELQRAYKRGYEDGCSSHSDQTEYPQPVKGGFKQYIISGATLVAWKCVSNNQLVKEIDKLFDSYQPRTKE